MSNFYSNTRKQLLGCMKMNGKQRIVTTALQILLETKGLVAPVCTLLLGFLLCTISLHLHCWPGSDCSERPKVQDLFAVPTQLWIASLGYPRQVFQVVFVSGLFSSSVCFHQNVDVLSCFVLETLFTHVTSSNSWFHTFGLLLLSTSWAQPVSHHASHVCWTNNNMLPPPILFPRVNLWKAPPGMWHLYRPRKCESEMLEATQISLQIWASKFSEMPA